MQLQVSILRRAQSQNIKVFHCKRVYFAATWIKGEKNLMYKGQGTTKNTTKNTGINANKRREVGVGNAVCHCNSDIVTYIKTCADKNSPLTVKCVCVCVCVCVRESEWVRERERERERAAGSTTQISIGPSLDWYRLSPSSASRTASIKYTSPSKKFH